MARKTLAGLALAAGAAALSSFGDPASSMWASPMPIDTRTQTALSSSTGDVDPFSSLYMTWLYGSPMNIRTDRVVPLVFVIR